MTAEEELRATVLGYVNRSISLGGLSRKVGEIIAEGEEAFGESPLPLAYRIELYLSEYDRGHRTEPELRSLLGSVVKEMPQ